MKDIFVKCLAVLLSVSILLSFAGCKEKTVKKNSSGSSDRRDEDEDQEQESIDTVEKCAVTIGKHRISSVIMNYFFHDAVQNERNQYGEYASYILTYDVTKPLNEQTYNQETGETWADYYWDIALSNACAVYAMYDLAQTTDFKLPELYTNHISNQLSHIEYGAKLYYAMEMDDYLSQTYGEGSGKESYEEYLTVQATATAYYTYYEQLLYASYSDKELREYEKDHSSDYDSYSFYSYTIHYTSFLEGGSKSESGATIFNDEEKAAARKAAEEAARALSAATTVEEFDALIADVANSNAKSAKSTDVAHTSLALQYALWLSKADRKQGDVFICPNVSTENNADGTVTEVINSYTVVMFDSKNDNKIPLANVRHLLVAFEGGTVDSSGNTTYSDGEKQLAKNEAESLLTQFLAGDGSEESFITLVKAHTDDEASAENGGLYENICKDSNYVDGFENWAISNIGNVGATGIVESPYGYHIMYYAGDSKTTYRDYLIKEELIAEDMRAWEESVTDSVVLKQEDTSGINFGLILQPAAE